jgi:hypothetical protein
MQHDLASRRANAKKLHDALKYLGVPVHDFGDGPAIAVEVFDDTEVGEHEVVNLEKLADALTFI